MHSSRELKVAEEELDVKGEVEGGIVHGRERGHGQWSSQQDLQ